jgi:membrane protein required for colicin V production
MEDLPANAVDLIIISVLLVSALVAFSRGFLRELLSVAGWVGAIFATLYGFSYAKSYARQWISPDILADAATGSTIFIATLIAVNLISNVLTDQVRDSALGAMDRSLGFLFGLFRGVIIVCFAYLLVARILPKEEQPEWLRSARTLPLVEESANILLELIPEGTIEKGSKTMNRAAKKTGETIREKIDESTQMENQRILKYLISPRPQAEAKDPEKGYNKTQRQDMDRLFETKDNP